MAAVMIPANRLFIPQALGNLSVHYDGRDFFVIDERSQKSLIQRHDLSPELRGITRENLEKCSALANFSLNKAGNDYFLRIQGRGLGGGPVAGAIGYWLTKSVCYGGAAAVAGTAIAATGGVAAGAAAGAAGALIPGGVAAGAVAGAIGSSAAATAAATEITIAAVGSAGGVAGAIAAVESASLFVGGVLTVCPFLP